MWWLVIGTALAGYGDAVEGVPTHAERELHVWTNAIRAEPELFAEDYELAGCRFEDFEPEEQESHRPMAWSSSLNKAARFHSDDMARNSFVDHTGSDGVHFAERVARYYPSTAVGENVAGGYSSPYQVIASGWMCSPGHRSNIMTSWWTEFGAGVSGAYYTQNFGGLGRPSRVLNMGVHLPAEPIGGDVTFLVDVSAEVKPDDVVVVLNGVAHDMKTSIGRARLGVRMAKVPVETGCHVYWFEAVVEGQTHRFPEDGAYGYGLCAFDDEAAGWMGAKSLAGPDSPVPDMTPVSSGGRGCASMGASLTAWWSLGLLVMRRRESMSRWDRRSMHVA
jgi:hypothetical protein